MRYAFALAVLLLPATGFAQTMGPSAPIPVQRCMQTATGTVCGPVRDGAGLAAADGYTRAHSGNDASAPLRAASNRPVEGPVLTP
jgi:hypothetical protein